MNGKAMVPGLLVTLILGGGLVYGIRLAVETVRMALHDKRVQAGVDNPQVVLTKATKRHARSNWQLLSDGIRFIERLLAADQINPVIRPDQVQTAQALVDEFRQDERERVNSRLSLDEALQDDAIRIYQQLDAVADFLEVILAYDVDHFLIPRSIRIEADVYVRQFRSAQRQQSNS